MQSSLPAGKMRRAAMASEERRVDPASCHGWTRMRNDGELFAITNAASRRPEPAPALPSIGQRRGAEPAEPKVGGVLGTRLLFDQFQHGRGTPALALRSLRRT